jgi:hypothetical protein
VTPESAYRQMFDQLNQHWPGLGITHVDSPPGMPVRSPVYSPFFSQPFAHGLAPATRVFPNITGAVSPWLDIRTLPSDDMSYASFAATGEAHPHAASALEPGGVYNYSLHPDELMAAQGQPQVSPERGRNFGQPTSTMSARHMVAHDAANLPMRVASHEAARRILNSGDLDLEWAASELLNDQFGDFNCASHAAGQRGIAPQMGLGSIISEDLRLVPETPRPGQDAFRRQMGVEPPSDAWAAQLDDMMEGRFRHSAGMATGGAGGGGLRLLQMAKRASPFMLGLGLLGGAASLLGKNPYSDRDRQDLPAALARAGGFA